jgi:hypothetical protein
MVREHSLKILAATFVVALAARAGAAELTHGPMIGHTTGTTARVWIRADGPCRLNVRALPKAGGKTISTEAIRLVKSDNFCGSVELKGLSPSTSYGYRILHAHRFCRNSRPSPRGDAPALCALASAIQ